MFCNACFEQTTRRQTDMKAEYMLRVRYFLAHNKIKVVLCQLAFLLVSSFILVPVVFRGFYLAIKLSGYSSITKENFLDVLIKPGSIIYILLLIVLLMVFMLLNLTMYIVLFDASLRHSRHGLIEYLVQVEKHFFRFFGKGRLCVFSTCFHLHLQYTCHRF